MTLGEACERVQEYARVYCENDILEGLRSMEETYEELDNDEQRAYRMFMTAGRAMFAPVDNC